MAGNIPRWSTASTPGNDYSSFYSETYSDASVDERVRNPDIGQRLHTLFKNQLYTDVRFVLSYGVKPKPTLEAHRAILAIGSGYFRDKFYDSNSNPLPGSSEVQINNVHYDAFRNVIEYLYTDDVIFENDQIVVDTLSAAVQFQVQPLVDKCESYIESVELTEDNVCTKLQMAISRGLTSLKNRCIEFVQENTGAVLRSDDFLEVNPSTVRTICRLEKFNLRSEMELLAGVIRYVGNRPDYKMDRRGAIDSFMRHIRLLNVSCDEFNQFVQRMPNIFTAPETAKILMAIAHPNSPAPNLPPWCKRGPNRCNFHSSAAPRERERTQELNVCRKLLIQLKPNNSKILVSNLVCILEMKCLYGKHSLDGLKLSFDGPVHERSIIGHLIISVDVQPSRYHFEEHIQIKQSETIDFKFSRRLLARRGDTVYIRTVAKEVNHYRFLQFGENNFIMKDSPFSCSLGSVPKENRLFMISEVLYRNAPVKPPPSHRSRASRK